METKQLDIFYNSVHLTGHKLTASKTQAKYQNDIVLDIFRFANIPLTPFDVHSLYCSKNPSCPVTSIRRAITTLTKAAKLIKTGTMKKEVFGKPNYKWKINDKGNHI